MALCASLHDPRGDPRRLRRQGREHRYATSQLPRRLYGQSHGTGPVGYPVRVLHHLRRRWFRLPRRLARVGAIAARCLPRPIELALAWRHYRHFHSGDRIQPPSLLGVRSMRSRTAKNHARGAVFFSPASKVR